MMQTLTVVPHPDGSGDSMIVLPDEIWAEAQKKGWREVDRYFITPVQDGIQLTRLVSQELKPSSVLRKSRFKRELNQHLRALKVNGVIGVGSPDYVFVRAALFDALVGLLSEVETDSRDQNSVGDQ